MLILFFFEYFAFNLTTNNALVKGSPIIDQNRLQTDQSLYYYNLLFFINKPVSFIRKECCIVTKVLISFLSQGC